MVCLFFVLDVVVVGIEVFGGDWLVGFVFGEVVGEDCVVGE